MAARTDRPSPSAAERWRQVVRSRLDEMAELRRPVDRSFWDRTADRYARRVAGTTEHDPFLDRVRGVVDPATVVADVGCGPGRFVLALAPHVAEVIALDPSERMLSILDAELANNGISNVRTLQARLEDVDELEADIVICSYVIPLIPELDSFTQRLDAAARRQVLIYMNAVTADLVIDPFWRHFHGRPRQPAPTYLDAVDVLAEIGITAEVEVATRPVAVTYASLDEAINHHRELLALPETPETREQLKRVLQPWLIRDGDLLVPPLRRHPVAIISWRPRAW